MITYWLLELYGFYDLERTLPDLINIGKERLIFIMAYNWKSMKGPSQKHPTCGDTRGHDSRYNIIKINSLLDIGNMGNFHVLTR